MRSYATHDKGDSHVTSATDTTHTESTTKTPIAATVPDFLGYMSGIRNAAPLTVKAYSGDIRHFLAWIAENAVTLRCATLTRDVIFRYLTNLGQLSPNTVRRRVHALSSWFNYLVDTGQLGSNPARGLPLPPRKRKLPACPTVEQCEKLLAAAASGLEQAVIWLLATAGLRRAELVGLDRDDLSADGSELHITGKGNMSRTVPLPHRTQQVIAEYLAARGDDQGPLLLNRVGKRLGPTSLRRIFQRLVRRAGLEECGFTLHSMRHGFATMLVKAGVDLGTIRDLLGHSDISVTSIYLHSDLHSKRDGVERLPILQIGGGGGE